MQPRNSLLSMPMPCLRVNSSHNSNTNTTNSTMSSDAPTTPPTRLAHAQYGKTDVRVLRVVRDTPTTHRLVEYAVSALLEGGIDVRCVSTIRADEDGWMG